MSEHDDSTTEGTEQAAEAAEQEPTESTEETDSQEETEADDDWRGEFNADRARRTITKLREELREAKADRTPQSEKDEKAIANLRKQLSDLEGKARGVDEKEKQIGAQEATILRYEVAFDLGLPKELVPRLQGSTKEELIEDAEKLLDLVTPAKRPATKRPAESLRGGGEPEREPEETDLSKIGERMFRR